MENGDVLVSLSTTTETILSGEQSQDDKHNGSIGRMKADFVITTIKKTWK